MQITPDPEVNQMNLLREENKRILQEYIKAIK